MSPCVQLETERLILRGHRESDLEDCAAMWSDAAVVRYIGGVALTREDVWSRLLRYAGHWELKGFGYWAVQEKRTGRFAGEAGFADFKREMTPSLEGAPEFGWVFARWAHGCGLAAEATGCMLDWARDNLKTGRMVCLIHPENAASIRLAAKLGFDRYESATYKSQSVKLFERLI